ncbi:ICMT-domain-containing protein [Lentinus tigrinus ALCF2SS1-7]|uniref:Protein-S-isoprenylcysteine O-methyltransferase n=1 Tax=Lentinus tigrinus ALCF2SS1-6 TaxID=1328759 RepID=A0A5C2SBB6_9APHY|nr:ICMT-domain-containing protein [Lentinus tigrinus ALCF2SS1-6]RPD75809.1 ICMT-domain-containing protein [Lentinus tigrinus ALCF2SS1-7]
MPLLAKVPMLVALGVAMKAAFIPPNQPEEPESDTEKYGSADHISRISHWFPWVGLTFAECLLASEVLTILAYEFPSHLSSILLSKLVTDPSSVPRLAITPSFAIATILLVSGAVIRQRCYNELGRLFTFQLTVLKGHTLVTSGPYSIVRHPAYTGFMAAIPGVIMVEMLPGTYPVESGLMTWLWVRLGMCMWTAWLVLACVIILRRPGKEDEVLKKEFGQEWEEWARKTPCKLLPRVY